MPLAASLARDIHHTLVLDRVLAQDDCDDPNDLSKLAETVWRKSGSQRSLVERFPRNRLRAAEPNRGYLMAAALLKEGAVADIITLNFDLALSTAVARIDGGEEITIIPGPDYHSDLGRANLIYLHRNVDCIDMDSWILTCKALEESWGDRWETIVVRRAAAVPVVVFVGLGSRAQVLEKAVAELRSAALNEVFLVDPAELESSEFAAALTLKPEQFIQAGWVEFADALGERVAADQRQRLIEACREQAALEGWPETDLTAVNELLSRMTLLCLGYLRSDCLLRISKYARSEAVTLSHLADLLLAVDWIAQQCNLVPQPLANGLIALVDEAGRERGVLGIASGRGLRSSVSLEAEIDRFRHYRRVVTQPAAYIVSGVNTPPTPIAPPSDIAIKHLPGDLVTGPGPWQTATAQEVRSGELLVEDLFL